MATTAEDTETTATENLQALLHEAEQALSDTAGDKFDDLRERLRVAVDSSKDTFARFRGQAVRRARQADQLVRENPYYSIGIAAGIGAVIGILVSRSNSSR
ncbi:MAG: protein ElaB [Lacunisphaera sp.]|nr:protein ElaB [Lacunisphaera sp.]MDB6165082.1 protein ElaB [Lacunisphaera sp.]